MVSLADSFLLYQTKSFYILQPELSYTMKGATTKIGPVSFTLAYDYVEVPILFKFALPLNDSPNIKPSVFAGPYMAFKTKAKIIAKANGESDEADIKSVTSRDYGVQFGCALGFNLGKI
ncbi:MAG: outer membrane beta-barrel protein [Ignavibacteriales bacterium]|nr:outer membrane beta-barrel protein [Ignavibacteriales bacterium]